MCGPGPGRVFTTAAGPGRAWASNHICGPGLGLDFRPVQDTNKHDSKSMHARIREMIQISGKRICSAPGCLKSREGNIIIEKEKILERWSEYISELYHDERGDKPPIMKNFDGPPIMKDEVRKAVKSMKNCIGVRADVHLGGGRPSFARMDSVGGGVVAEFFFRDPYSVGGGGSSRNFPGSIFCGVPEFCPLTPVPDPKFVFLSLNSSNRP